MTSSGEISLPSQSSVVIQTLKGRFFSDAAGNWRTEMYGLFSFSSYVGQSIDLNFANISFKGLASYFTPGGIGLWVDTASLFVYNSTSASTIYIDARAAKTGTSASISLSYQLAQEPTTYTTASNMETPKMTPFIKLYDDAGAITMSGSPFTGSNFSEQFITKTASFTAELNKSYVINSGSAVAVTLPAMTIDSVITFKNIGAGIVTLNRAGSDTIDGQTSLTISQYQAVKIKGFNTNLWGVY